MDQQNNHGDSERNRDGPEDTQLGKERSDGGTQQCSGND